MIESCYAEAYNTPNKSQWTGMFTEAHVKTYQECMARKGHPKIQAMRMEIWKTANTGQGGQGITYETLEKAEDAAMSLCFDEIFGPGVDKGSQSISSDDPEGRKFDDCVEKKRIWKAPWNEHRGSAISAYG